MIPALILTLAGLYALDIYTTMIGVVGMGLHEFNPLMRWGLSWPEPLSVLIALKAVSLIGVMAVVYLLSKSSVSRKGTIITLMLVNVIMTAVVIWNAVAIWL